jgi:hypothetical protein
MTARAIKDRNMQMGNKLRALLYAEETLLGNCFLAFFLNNYSQLG